MTRNLDQLRSLLDRGMDPTCNDNYPLRRACETGQLAVIELLLSCPGIHPQVCNNCPIRMACREGHVEVVKFLLSRGADPTAKHNFALRMASRNGHVEVVKLLLQIKDVDPADKDNESLRMAVRNGHQAVVEVLRRHPAVLRQLRISPVVEAQSIVDRMTAIERSELGLLVSIDETLEKDGTLTCLALIAVIFVPLNKDN